MPHPDSTDFLDSGLFLDLEVNPASGVITQVGARLGEMHWKAAGARVRHALADIGEAAAKAAFVAGHNLLDHDLRVLERALPDSPLLKLPAVDTLVLSTLAFPKKPFHALTKDYKQSETDRNNPLFDADRAKSLLGDSLARLRAHAEAEPDLARCLSAALAGVAPAPKRDSEGRRSNAARAGFRLVFEQVGIRPPSGGDGAPWVAFLSGKACESVAPGIPGRLAAAAGPDIPLAFATAWLSEPGATFPAWAARRFRPMVELLRAWRSTPCGDPACAFCAAHHDAEATFKSLTGFPGFRPYPELKDNPGVSLQGELVRRGLSDESLLGILPTGGGKSLCFQIPAIARHRHHGALTVVVSPLQALMRDQVDNFAGNLALTNAGALYGGMNPVDRKMLLNEVADGSVGLLYLSPEQLRNTPIKNLLKLRTIGAWVFDEAHCLAKWGHDFRPDYLAVHRAIREIADAQGVPIPPVQAYTATAKADVRDEITAYFRQNLGRDPAVLDGGAERTNLTYRVEPVPAAAKVTRIRELLTETLGEDRPGAAVVFCSSRKDTEQVAGELSRTGFPCPHFHAGLDREVKEELLSRFKRGDFRVITATNAFGMGVDKNDIRLVIHHGMPGSLENYIQEAGRAGRDGLPAEAVLLYDEASDADRQFDLLDAGRLDKRDIEGILRTVRARARVAGAAVITSTEIAETLSPNSVFERLDDTAVKAAIAHLERCEFVRRDDNVNRVFQVTPLVRSLTEAQERLDRAALPDSRKALARAIMRTVLDPDLRSPSEFLCALQSLEDMRPLYEAAREKAGGRAPNETRIVLDVLAELCDPALGLLKRDLTFSAIVPLSPAKNPVLYWRRTAAMEAGLLALLKDAAPDLGGATHPFDAARLACALLTDPEQTVTAGTVSKTLLRWAKDWRRLRPDAGELSVRLRGDLGALAAGSDLTWSDLETLLTLRAHACSLFAEHLMAKARRARTGKPAEATPGAREDSMTEFTESELMTLLRDDLVVASHSLPSKVLAALTLQALVTLDATFALQLVGGKSVITSAMTLHLHPAARARYTKGDHEALEWNHKERIAQVHVIAGYASRCAQGAKEAVRMLVEYFVLAKAAFIERYFRDNPGQLDLACTLASFQKITQNLSATQRAIVCENKERNLMILAGPGSGKTAVVVRRIAFLVKVRRENPARIAVMCYNRHAALELRRRLHDLIGPRAAALVIGTYHGLALRLTGGRPAAERRVGSKRPEVSDFDRLLRDATALLEGRVTPAGEDDTLFLERLRGGFTHLFVDEYQDITPDAYRFVAALAGKASDKREGKPQLTAVGDDDQSIYGFNGANADFIRSFESDYAAERVCLLENFRSSPAIIEAANAWIAGCPGRMKQDPGRPDSRRHDIRDDAFASRPVRRFSVRAEAASPRFAIARAAIGALKRIRTADAAFAWSRCALVARWNEDLAPLRQLLLDEGIPHRLAPGSKPPNPARDRTAYALLAGLRADTREFVAVDEVLKRLAAGVDSPSTSWMRALVDEYAASHEGPVGPGDLANHIADGLAELRAGVRPGDGVLLSTAHGTKGLEFDHVVVLDGEHWAPPANADELRLLYVSMTRAKRSLSFVMSELRPGPLFRRLESLGIGESSPVTVSLADPAPALRFETLSLEDYFIDFLGRKSPNDRAHRALADLQPGAALTLRETPEGFLHLVTPERAPVAVAALSKSGRERLARALAANRLRSVTLISCYTRLAADAENPDRLACERWEIPLVEIVVADDA